MIANRSSITSFTYDCCSLVLGWQPIIYCQFYPSMMFAHLLHCGNQLWHGSITEIALHSSMLYSGKSKCLVCFITGLPFVFCLSKAGHRSTVKLYFLLERIHASQMSATPCWPFHSSVLSSSLHIVWVCLSWVHHRVYILESLHWLASYISAFLCHHHSHVCKRWSWLGGKKVALFAFLLIPTSECMSLPWHASLQCLLLGCSVLKCWFGAVTLPLQVYGTSLRLWQW